jgi:hypothetical protein
MIAHSAPVHKLARAAYYIVRDNVDSTIDGFLYDSRERMALT